MDDSHFLGTMTVLSDGTVLVAGGATGDTVLDSAEIYNPTSETFTTVSSSLTQPREDDAAVVLSDGRVVMFGGDDGTVDLSTIEIFGPPTSAT